MSLQVKQHISCANRQDERKEVLIDGNKVVEDEIKARREERMITIKQANLKNPSSIKSSPYQNTPISLSSNGKQQCNKVNKFNIDKSSKYNNSGHTSNMNDVSNDNGCGSDKNVHDNDHDQDASERRNHQHHTAAARNDENPIDESENSSSQESQAANEQNPQQQDNSKSTISKTEEAAKKMASCLLDAASSGNVESVRLLLRCGADVNARNESVSEECDSCLPRMPEKSVLVSSLTVISSILLHMCVCVLFQQSISVDAACNLRLSHRIRRHP